METGLKQLKNRIMRRVYTIWFAREIAPKLALIGVFAYFGATMAATGFFWARIFENFISSAGQSLWNIPRFIAAALNSAEPQLLIILSILGTVSFFMAIKLLRSMRVLLKQGYFSSNFNTVKVK